MKKNHQTGLLSVLLAMQSISFFADGQNTKITTFQNHYTAAINQSGQDVLQTSDGGYLIASTTETSILNDLDILITKTDSAGVTLWTKRYGGSKPEYPNGMLQTNDGNFFVIGSTQSFGAGDLNHYLLKLKPNGDTLFTKVYGGNGNDEGHEIVATADGNYVFSGGSNSVHLTDYNMELMKIDPSGKELWTQYYGGPKYESARSVKLCLDGGFILAGHTALSDTSVANIFLVKTNSVGDTLWTKIYGGPDSYDGKSVLANTDGTFTLCADDSSLAHDSDIRVMNISSTGTILWNKSYGGVDKDICKMIQHTTDGGYIVAGISRSFGWINPDMWLLKLNAMGDTLWTRHFGGPKHEHCYAVRQTSDGGFITVGHTTSWTVNTEIYLVKFYVAPRSVAVEELALNNTINVYPNPSNGIVKIDLGENITSAMLKIQNALGQEVFSEIINTSNQIDSRSINLEGKEPGIYFITIQLNNQRSTKKIVLQ